MSALFSWVKAQNMDANQNKNTGILVEKESITHFLNLGDSLVLAKNNEKAEIAYKESYQLSKKAGYKELLITTGFKLEAFLFHNLRKDAEALEIIDFLFDYCSKNEDPDCLVRAYFRSSALQNRQLQYNKALENIEMGQQLANKNKNLRLIWESHYLKGDLFLSIGDWEMAKKEFSKLIAVVPEENHEYYETMTYINMSSSFKDPDSILHYSQIAEKNCKAFGNKRECNLAYNNIAWAYVLKDMPQRALDIINTNVNISSVEHDYRDSLYASLMHTLGIIHYKLGNYEKSIAYYKMSLEYDIKDNNIIEIMMTKEDMSRSYEKLGNFKSAVQLLKEVKLLDKKSDYINLKREVAKIEMKKILDKKEEQIENLEQENQEISIAKSKTKLFSYFLGVFLILILSAVLYRGYQNKVRFHQLNEELSLSKMKSLRSMMNPHFLFNSFSTLQNYILKKKNKEANEYMTELSSLIRTVLASTESIYISLSEETALLKSYLRIERERFDYKFEEVFEIEEELLIEDPIIPSMIIQPYIENAIIHGFSHLERKGLLSIKFKQNKNTIICTVTDNGVGRSAAERFKKANNASNHLSLATRNTNERLRILDRIANNSASVTIEDLVCTSKKSNGTRVTIILPVKQRNKKDESVA
ncbi:histidine kinase [Maribacter sp. 2308TA10-17]|uniref:tetratricopeptide repeat-containing sensor histidine kinase n=1 Tax=Maribacter sp. 2308TA10-17 TaxID=3386276 RepID=UPI0039BC9599